MSETTSPASRELPRYRSHKEVWALKIASITPDRLPTWQRATCKGSYALGSACGQCERCAWESQHGPGPLGAMITPAEPGHGPFRVDAKYIAKHNPEVGGYWVRYDDGYESFSPAAAFEEGYSRV